MNLKIIFLIISVLTLTACQAHVKQTMTPTIAIKACNSGVFEYIDENVIVRCSNPRSSNLHWVD